jgi:hypothetical protein
VGGGGVELFKNSTACTFELFIVNVNRFGFDANFVNLVSDS